MPTTSVLRGENPQSPPAAIAFNWTMISKVKISRRKQEKVPKSASNNVQRIRSNAFSSEVASLLLNKDT